MSDDDIWVDDAVPPLAADDPDGFPDKLEVVDSARWYGPDTVEQSFLNSKTSLSVSPGSPGSAG